jgi:hypothetical protein
MHKPVKFFHAAVGLLLFGLATSSVAADIQSVQRTTLDSLHQEQQAQQLADRWGEEKLALVNDILDQKTRLQWNRYQNGQYRQYIETKNAEIEELQAQKKKMQQLRMTLEPYLERTLAELESFVQADLPFLPEERADRLRYLRSSLGDPELALGEKLRRILEGLKVEADYGNHIEVTSEKLDLDGQATLVSVLRLGRTALFYLAKDGGQLGMWNPVGGGWSELDEEYAASLQLTMDVVQRKRAAELVELPLGRVEL